MVKEKASSYLLEKYKVMEGMEELHEIVKRKLPAILDVITDAEEQAAHREGAKAWLQALKKVAYEANEVFDEFKYEALRREAKEDGHYHKLGFMNEVKLFPSPNQIVFSYKMGKKLRKIVQSIEVLVTEMNDFGFRYHRQPHVSQQPRHIDHNIFDPTKIVERSRGKDKQKVIDILLSQSCNTNLTVVPIVGMGGLGKTTLVQLVYNDPQVQKHFQLLLWVCVSDNFDVDSVARSIVAAATTSERDDSKPSLDRLQKVVSAKKYLLVLDDIWKTGINFFDRWEKLKACLQCGGNGSAVLITTRDEGVAEATGTTEGYKLTVLENTFIEEIIKIRAFSLQEEKPKLLQMVGQIAQRCVGSPLAATAIGSVLRTKTNVEEWKAVLRKGTICDDEAGILPILKLSYNDLPSHMKQCFAFCALFPKDYEIDVDKMIQIWMANDFIPTKKELRPETIGKQIFNELASRSFFQEVKQGPVDKYKSINGYCSRITCRIHDLMHDVAQSVMQNECVTIPENSSPLELFSSTTHHLFLLCKNQDSLLNHSFKKTSPPIQTLLFGEAQVYGSLQHQSKYSSVRALRLRQHGSTFLLKPKHLHRLRYLDLSHSEIRTLPEDITILHNLQTLNLSRCYYLHRLPRHMKYMNALRHLYTEGCSKLMCMPPGLGRLTSLQTLTFFVFGADSDCSNLGDLKHLNLCGQLELSQLENVAGADTKVAKLENKEELRKLILTWNQPSLEKEGCYRTVLQGFKPHTGLQALKIYGYLGATLPTWICTLQNMVELCLSNCKKLQKLPPLWQIQELRLLKLRRMDKLKILCSGDTSYTFKKLKELELTSMTDFERWCETDSRQQIFPQLEKLSIQGCNKLTTLPEPPLMLGDHTRFNSAFPELKVIWLNGLSNFTSWEVVEGTDGEQTIFPNLENACIKKCPQVTYYPKAPKLSTLEIDCGNQQIYLQAARYMNSLSHFNLACYGLEMELLSDPMDSMQMQNNKPPLSIMKFDGCNLFFLSSALSLCKCFVQLQDLTIFRCNGLVHWPEKEFNSLVSLKTLTISECKELIGYAQSPDETSSERIQLLPCLDSLIITECESLMEIFNVSSSLKNLAIRVCHKLKLTFRKQAPSLKRIGQDELQEGSTEVTDQDEQQDESVNQPRTGIMPPYMYVPKLSPTSTTELFLPCLESLTLYSCHGISELLNLPSTLKYTQIELCHDIHIISGQLDALQELTIFCNNMLRSLESFSGTLPLLKSLYISDCRCLLAIPDEAQAYTSLQSLDIRNCPGMKSLPRCLQQRLDSLERKNIDAHYEGIMLSKPKTWKYICHS